jgi:hypothetical protein
MSLERKDVRLKLSVDAHAELTVLADFHEKDVSEYASLLLERALLGEGHVLRLYVEKAARLGKSGKAGDSQGFSGKTSIRRVK